MVFCIKIWWLIPCIDHVLYICTPQPIMNLLLNCTIMWLAGQASLAKCRRKIYIFSLLFASTNAWIHNVHEAQTDAFKNHIIQISIWLPYELHARSVICSPSHCLCSLFFLFPIFFFFLSFHWFLWCESIGFLYQKPMATNKNPKKKKERNKRAMIFGKDGKKIYHEIQCGNKIWRMTNDEWRTMNGKWRTAKASIKLNFNEPNELWTET